MANFTPQEIEEMLQEFFSTTGKRQYIGARYVPIFGRKNSTTCEWDNSDAYEPLTIVIYQGNSYTSKQYVPKDIDITDTNYWVQTGNWNAQIEQYRQEVLNFQAQINDRVPYPTLPYSKYGIVGQVLSTLADGSTEWQDPVIPSDEQAEEIITNWLNEHPEATTTVLDGAITTAKIANGAVTDNKLAPSGGVLSDVSWLKNAVAANNKDSYKLTGNIQGYWKQGGMYGATGIEYVNNTTIITPFIKVNPSDTIYINIQDVTLVLNILEFADNITTSTGVNERLAIQYANSTVKSIAIGSTTNYIRLQLNTSDTTKGDDVLLYTKNSVIFNDINNKFATANTTIENLTEIALVFPETSNGYINQYGKLVSASSFFTTDYLVASGRLSCIGTIKWLSDEYYYINCYDLNKRYIGGVMQGGDAITYNTPTLVSLLQKTAFIRVTKNNAADNNMRIFCADITTPQEYVSADRCLSFIVNSPNLVKIKLIGDSITAGLGGTGFNASSTGGGALIYDTVYQNVAGHCWANSMKAYFEDKFNVEVINNGVSGIGAGTMIAHWNDLVESSDDVVICMIGTNNRASSSTLSDFIAYLETIVSLAKNGNYQFIMMANIPASVNNENDGKHFHMEDVEHAIRYVTDKHNIPFVNVYSKFIEYCKYTNTTIDSYLGDGLHPNDNGYDVMFYLICNEFGIGTKRPDANW